MNKFMEFIKNFFAKYPEWYLFIYDWYNLIAEYSTESLILLIIFILILFFIRNRNGHI